MKRIVYILFITVQLFSTHLFAQLTIVDTINFRPAYLEDSLPYILRRNDHFIDDNGNFWIGFSNLGARRLTDTLWTEFITANSGIASNYVLDVSQSADNKMWFGTNNGVSVYDGSNWTNYNSSNGLISDTVTVIDHHNNTHWIGTRNGLSKFDGTTFTNYNTSNSGLPADSIMCLTTDQNGNVWVGTKFGLAFFDGSQWSLYDSLHQNIERNIIYDIKIDNAGVIWVVTGTNEIFYLKNGVFVNYFKTNFPYACVDFLPDDNIFYLAKGDDGLVYFTSNRHQQLTRVSAKDSISSFATFTNHYLFSPLKILIKNNKDYLVSETTSNSYSFSSSYSIYVYDNNTSNFNKSSLIPSYPQYSYGIFSDTLNHDAQCNLNVNEIFARILNKGDMHWDPVSEVNYYKVPLCNGKQTVFASAIWLGGIDQSGNLHTAAQTYRQQGANDFYTGPLDTIAAQSDSLTRVNYDKLWKVDQWMKRMESCGLLITKRGPTELVEKN